MNTLARILTVAVSLILLAGATTTHALTFSLSGPSPTVGGGGIMNEDDLANPGPVPAVVVPGVAPPVGGSGIEVNGISYGRLGGLPAAGIAYFSVAPVAPGPVGAPGTAVDGEANGFGGIPGLGDHTADVYSSVLGGFNAQIWDGDGAVAFPLTPGAPSPAVGLLEGPGFDDIDAIDIRFVPGLIGGVFWTVDLATTGALAPYAGFLPGDVFFGPPAAGYSAPPAAPYAGAGLLGLAALDDMDALVYFEDGMAGATPGDVVLFSLAAGSPTLGLLGATPADILITGPGAPPGIFAPAGAIGLLPTDELNALDFIPEPGSAALLLLGLTGLLRRRRS